MSQRPFLKPSPDKPPALTAWLKRSDRAEVGREPFFSGRDVDYEVFRNAAGSLHEGFLGGGTVIFQGAPGAGKSALMQECIKAVRSHSTSEDPWIAVAVNPGTLKSPVSVVTDLVDAAKKESERLARTAPDSISRQLKKWQRLGSQLYEELSVRGAGVAGVSVGGKSEAENLSNAGTPAGPIFRRAAGLLEKFHTVVFVDEAQNTPVESSLTRDVLDCLHRDPQGIPLVAMFFGLSDTEEILGKCGLSRLPDERIVNLEPLSDQEAASSLRCMLETYFTDSEKQVALWSNALAQLSQGWPQHINRVGVAAARVIRSNNGSLDERFLEQAIAEGTERKNVYYLGRLKAASSEPWVYKHLAVAACSKEGESAGMLSFHEIDELTHAARMRHNQSINEFLTNALHAGLLAQVKALPYHYQFPIPSMSDYLRSLPVEAPRTA